MIVVKNFSKESQIELVNIMAKWINTKVVKNSGGREWPYYSGKQHRILFEKFLESESEQGGLIDYKFFCFNGRAKYLYVIADRNLGKKAGLAIYDMNFTKLPYERYDESPLKRDIHKPINFEKMVEYAEKLSEDFPHVRVDLYNVNGSIYFGELTFFDGSGYMSFQPDDFDYILGHEFITENISERGC